MVEALALSAAAAAVATAEADRPLVAAAAMVAGYLGAARMLWPLRAELDVPSRTRVLLRPRTGRVLLEHLIVPVSVTAVGAGTGAAAVAIGGQPGAVLPLIAIVVAPLLTLCAAMSARRGGRVPQTLLATALAADPTGGGTAIAGWFAWWPCVAVITGVAPLALAESGALAPAVAWILAAAAVLTWLASRDLDTESK